MKIFNTSKMLLYKKALDVHAKQHESIAQNVANANNPEYKRVNTNFQEELMVASSEGLKKSHELHMELKSLESGVAKSEEKGGVDINKEMGELAVNQIRFDFISRALKKAYSGLNSSITGRSS